MGNFRLSPFKEGKPTAKKSRFPWLWLFVTIETLAAGVYIFRLHERIDYLELRVRESYGGENANV